MEERAGVPRKRDETSRSVEEGDEKKKGGKKKRGGGGKAIQLNLNVMAEHEVIINLAHGIPTFVVISRNTR